MSTIKVSFVIPTFNRAKSLHLAIESIIIQTGVNWELIIIDDGSTDETKSIVQQYRGEPRIKYKFQHNQGVSVARNAGADIAEGDYLIFLDSDDVFFPELMKKLRSITFEEYDIIFWQVKKEINGNFSIWKPTNLGPLYNKIFATFLAGSFCIRKRIFKQVGGYDPKMTFGENYELGIRISHVKSLVTKYIEVPLLFYSVNPKTRESNSLENRLASHLYQYYKHEELYEKSRGAKAEMAYIIGFTLECSNKKDAALDWYIKGWKSSPWKIKPLLKILYIALF